MTEKIVDAIKSLFVEVAYLCRSPLDTLRFEGF
jgi:hypothetical protein